MLFSSLKKSDKITGIKEAMAREIEIKARVLNPRDIRIKISRFAELLGAFEKVDAYWQPQEPEKIPGSPRYGIRSRKEKFMNTGGKTKETVYITWKFKEVRNGMEFNDEKELEVSSGEIIEELLEHLGFRLETSKQKKGSVYTLGTMTIEITEVESLGWFLEMEILLSESNENSEEAARDILLSTLEELGINREAVESRSYSQMMSELGLAELLLDNPGSY